MSLLPVGTFNFKEEVEDYQGPVIVLVSSENCVACRNFTKVVEQASITHSKYFKFVLLQSDRSPELALDLADGNYPSTVIYNKGKFLINFIGSHDLPYFLEFLNRQITSIKRREYAASKGGVPQA